MKSWSKLFSRLLNKENRKESRIVLKDFHDLALSIGAKKYQINNISMHGIGFKVKGKTEFATDKIYNAILNLNNDEQRIKIQIVYISNSYVGASILEVSDEFINILSDYFDSEIKALSLKEIGHEHLQKDVNGEPTWFYGGSNYEIYFTTKNDVVTSFQINFYGYVATMESNKFHLGIKLEEDRAGEYKTSDIVSKNIELSEKFKKMMLRFIDSVDKMDSVYKSQIMARLIDEFEVSYGA